MRNCISLSAILLAVVLTGQAHAAVWTANNQWDSSWEDRYSAWVKSSFNTDIFTKGKYKGISTDCADAVYASRAIFAFENKLPFVVLDPSGGDSKISNRMSRWDDDSEMERFRQFIDYINEMTDTKSLPRDTYPVAITREYVRSGAIWSRPRIAQGNFFKFLFGGKVKEDPGHAELVKDVTETGAIELIGSTVPSAVRNLISTSSLVFMPVESSTGLRQWKAPGMYEMKSSELPGYSMEQFKMGDSEEVNSRYGSDYGGGGGNRRPRDLAGWAKEVQGRLQLRAEEKEEALQRFANNLCSLVQARVDVIQKSERARLALGSECMNAEDFDSYSTPSRDKRIKTTIEELANMNGSRKLEKLKKYTDSCPSVQITADRSMSLLEVAQAYADKKVSSNPNDSLGARWGLSDSGKGKSCPKY